MPTSTGLYDTSTVTYDQSSLSYDGYPAPPANMPGVGVYIAFDDGPYEYDPAWTEVSTYVRAVSVRRGRANDLEDFPSGTATLTLDNRDGRFNPLNSAGPYYGKLLARRQIKIYAVWEGVGYDLYRGYISGWPVEYSDAGFDSTVTLNCFDALGLLGAEVANTDWVGYYIQQANPFAWWRCRETAPTTEIVDQIGGRIIDTTFGTNAFQDEALGEGFQSKSLLSPVGIFLGPKTAARNFVVTMWSKASLGLGSFFAGANGLIAQFGDYRVTLSQYPDALSQIQVMNLTTTWLYDVNGNDARFDQPTFWVFYVSNGAVTAYANNQLVSLSLNTTSAGFNDQDQVWIFDLSFQDLAVFSTLSADQRTDIYEAGIARFTETTAARAPRVMGESSFPSTLIDYELSTDVYVSQIKSDQSTLEEVQQIADSDGGDTFIDRSGNLVITGRDYVFSEPRCNTNLNNVFFTDVGTGVYYDASSIRVRIDADYIRNESTISFTGGGNITDTDATSVANYGRASESIDTLLADADEATDLADRRVTVFKNPKVQIDPFVVKPQKDPSYVFERILPIELLDRVSFRNTPKSGASAVQKDLLVQSIEHNFTPGTWQTVINGSSRYTNWFILGVSLLGGEDLLL